MELLERDEALAALAGARESAARGKGRVAFVTGEPGIGKTTLVTRFVADLGPDARVLVGTCDDLSVPRPLGPIRDLVGASPALADALSGAAAAHDIQALLIAELEAPPRPTVLVIEDVHWADDATLDAITILGRRIGTLPAVMVMTFRPGEVPPGHALHAAIGAIRADHAVDVDLAPLSERAVAALTGGPSESVYAATGGNPFYVTELMCCTDTDEPPRSVQNAVLGRASRLDPDSRRLVELVSVVPSRVSITLLDAVMPDWAAAAEEPERRQLLEVDTSHVHFRHELARNAIQSGIPIVARRRLHGQIVEALLAADADPADIVHHAEAAGAEDIVVDHVLVAARRAAALESNRQAYLHYRRAAALADRIPPDDRAAMYEEFATAAYLVARLEDSFSAIDTAIATFRALGDEASVGRCTRALSRWHWYAGNGVAARDAALEAISILEPLGESRHLARAYSELGQLAMLEEDEDGCIEWGTRALDLATRLGDESTRAHALVNIGTIRLQSDHSSVETLLEAHAVADAAGERHEASRALGNLAFTLMCWARPEEATRFGERALAYAEQHEVHALTSYLEMMLAWLRLRAGEWDEAERVARAEIGSQVTVVQLLAKTVVTQLAVRRGDPDADELLADLTAQAERTGEPQRIGPTLELATDWALNGGTPIPTERFQALLDRILARGPLTGWSAVRVAAWAAVAGTEIAYDGPSSPPHAAMVRRDWRAAADAYGEVGWMYDRALMLSLLDDEDSLVEALEIARGLGAEPLTRRVAGRLRDLGMRVPHGPREATRANPAGLTARQLDVLVLLVEGLTNSEIAERLVVSPKTAEHHVAAVLGKLGASTRREAARRATELGMVAGA